MKNSTKWFMGMIVGLFVLASYLPRAKAAEKDLYNFLWLDPDKKVYVLQNKVYKREHTVYLDVGYLKALSSKFQNTNGFKIKGCLLYTSPSPRD